MPNATSELARIRFLAQVFTIGAATLYSVLWVVTIVGHSTTTTDGVGIVLGAVTVVGGVCMGLLYAFDRWRAWSTQKTG